MKNYWKLKEIIDETSQLLAKGVRKSDPEFFAWETKIERFLLKEYGGDSSEVEQFNRIRFAPRAWTAETSDSVFVRYCADGLRKAVALLSGYLEEMAEKEIENADRLKSEPVSSTNNYGKVFVVHGHNGEMKEAVARLIERQNISAIILHEQANMGDTIIEKFERNSNVGAAVCLFTADDLGRAKSTDVDRKRARQNVVFEAGYFIGKLGRSNVLIIADPGIEIPSDMQGIVYTDSANWQFSVLKELKAIGYNIDYNKLG